MSTIITQLTPLFEYLIRGDSLPLTFVITQKIRVPTWTDKASILIDECVKGTVITDYYFQCTTAGTTGDTEPDWASYNDVDDTLTDGDVEWINRGELFLTADVDIAKQPLDITGWKVFVTVKTNPDDTDEEAQVAFEYEFDDSDESKAGKVSITIPASLMTGLIPGYAYMDVQLIIPNNGDEDIVKTFGLGKIKIYADMSIRVAE